MDLLPQETCLELAIKTFYRGRSTVEAGAMRMECHVPLTKTRLLRGRVRTGHQDVLDRSTQEVGALWTECHAPLAKTRLLRGMIWQVDGRWWLTSARP